MCHVKSTPYKVFMASFKKLKIYCLEIHAASVRSSLISCLSCFCSAKLSGSLLPPVPLFDQTLRHIAYRAMSSMNHYGGIYWKLCFWKSVKKWKFKTFDGMKIHHMMHFHHIIYIKIFIKKWKCAWKSTICHILQIWLSLIIWNNYDFQDTSAHPPVHSLAVRPFEEQPHYMMMKSRHMLESHHVMESHY